MRLSKDQDSSSDQGLVVDLLKRFTAQALLRLSDLIRDLVYEQAERSQLARLTIDLDCTVLLTGAKIDGAARGFNPHHPTSRGG